MYIGSRAVTGVTLEPGCWYEIEIVLDISTGAVEIYVDRELVHTYTVTSGQTISSLCMGIQGGWLYVEANVGFAIDNLAVYDHAARVSATVDENKYATVQDAVNYAVENGGTVVLQRPTDEIITVKADDKLVLDLNGHTVGEIIVDGTLCGIDATTKVYSAEPLEVKVSVGGGTVAPVYKVDDGTKAHAYAGYAAKVDEDGYATFNYFELKITNVTLRPGDAGIGYKLDLAGNAKVKAMLNADKAFGVRVYRFNNPNGGKEAYAGADAFQVGKQTKMVMIKNILSDAAGAVAQNVINLDEKLCVEAYMQIGDEKVQIAYTAGMNLREVLVAVDATVGSLTDTQTGELVKMYEKYGLGNAAYGLNISGIAGLVSKEAK